MKRSLYCPSLWLLCPFIAFLSACDSEKNPAPVDCNKSDLALTLTSVTDASCGESNGSVTVTASGGQAPYQYKLGSNDFRSGGTFGDLSPGNYTLTVQDDLGCETTVSGEVMAEGSTLAFNNITTTNSGCKTSEGSITVSATGEGTVEYKINNGTYQTNNVFTGLTAGVHNIFIIDDSGCESTSQKQVLSGTSYEASVHDILIANCAISGCHNGDNGSIPNLTVFSNVQNKATSIKNRTQNGSMPPASSGKSLTQEQKDLIACWVDDGAMDN